MGRRTLHSTPRKSVAQGRRIVYIGAERVGLACLQRLIHAGKNVVGVFTAHDELRPQIADFISFDEHIMRAPAPLFKIKKSSNSAFIRQVKALRPELIVVVSWSGIIPREVIDSAPLGCVGIHYSRLPKRRGGAPLNWAIMDGLRESGITLYFMDAGIDTGDIIAQKSFDISRDDTAKTLLDKIVVLAPALLAEQIGRIELRKARRMKQDSSRASYTKRRSPAESRIDWTKSDKKLYDFIRALGPPYPSAFTVIGNRRLVIPSARLENGRLWIEGYLE